jgi:hypothetical protein
MTAPVTPREHLAAMLAFAQRAARGARYGALALGVGIIVTVALALSTHRLYRSEALLAYEGGVQAVALGADGVNPRAMAARVNDMVTSRERLGTIIKDMKLYRGIVDRRGLVDAIDEMRRHLTINAHEGTSYRIAYDGDTRDQAKDVLDRLVSGVVAEDHARQLKDVEETRKLLETERRAAEDELKKKEAALSAFLTDHPQLAGEVGAASSGGLIRAADRDRAAAAGGGDVAGLELQAAQLEEALAAAGQRPVVGGVAVADPQLVAASERAQIELQAAERDLADKQARLTNEHPDVKMALRRVSTAEAAARRAQAAVAASRIPPPASAAPVAAPADDARTAALKRALSAVRQQISAAHGRGAPRPEMPKAGQQSMVAIDTEWIRLNREATEARDRATQLQTKQFQADLAASVTSAGEGGRLVVADRPFKPLRPVAGGRFKIALLGATGSIFLALLTMILLAMFDDHLYAAPDIQRLLDDGFVVVIPTAPRKLLMKAADGPPDVLEGGTASGARG